MSNVVKHQRKRGHTSKGRETQFRHAKNNGLIQKPLVAKQNYAHFEIVEQQPKQIDSLFSRNHSVKSRTVSSSDNGSLSSESNLKKLPPARLLKLEKNAKPAMTSDQIEEKILKANQRKKVKINFNYGFIENKSTLLCPI